MKIRHKVQITTYLYKKENAKGIAKSLPEVRELFIEDEQLLPMRQGCSGQSGKNKEVLNAMLVTGY